MQIGLNDIATEGRWMLSGSNSVATYTNWKTWSSASEEKAKRRENCAMMYIKGNGEWNDIACDYEFPYVCEKGEYFTQLLLLPSNTIIQP